MAQNARPGPTLFVLFGATGDLARRMVLPAFYTLAKENLLPSDWMLLGNGRGDVAHEDFRAHVRQVLTDAGESLNDGTWKAFSDRLRFAGGGFASDDPGSLLDVLAEARAEVGPDAQLILYLAVPPVALAGLSEGLGEH
ncbi:MAG: zwf, partial [Jatrophihabitans sp.]|nr:zwf [Jatrophihabitans sp.]